MTVGFDEEAGPDTSPGGIEARYSLFIAEQFPFAFHPASKAFEDVVAAAGESGAHGEEIIGRLRQSLGDALRGALDRTLTLSAASGRLESINRNETTPGVNPRDRLARAVDEIVEASDGFLAREAIRASLTPEERREILRGMILTRATDNRLKQFFVSGEVRFGNGSFQGKGFRSLGQEAIYASAVRLRRGESFLDEQGRWTGDFVAPLIRDLGAALAMAPDAEAVRMVLSAQMGKAGPPMDGRDFHVGDFDRGVLPASAPLSISTLTVAGLAMGFALEGSDRVAVSFIGEGGSSLGEWHEAINLCAARKLPAIFCLQNNQTALGTPVREQSAARVFAERAAGYGIPGLSIDGTDPDEIATAFAWAAHRARTGQGPTLIETISMRMCGHAHHDDMLYVGKEPPISWDYPTLHEGGYADRALWEFWSRRDPIARYAARLESEGVIESGMVDGWKKEFADLVEAQAQEVISAPWPEPESAGDRVLAGEPRRVHVEILSDPERSSNPEAPSLEVAPPFDPKGKTLLESVMLGLSDALASDERVFVYGEDVGGKYGNAFLLLRPLLAEYGDRIVNATLAEGGVIGVCVGSALAGRRPIGEIQFNDFVATGFNQIVNNAAKARYRWGASVPMVLRMPWGGLRSAGPYHSQNTEPWFYRTPGLKIVVPSTPNDARALMASAVADPDPVLFYEHIALYRDPRIKQAIVEAPPNPIPIGKAALRRDGGDLLIISYGAYVHSSMRVAARLETDGVEAAVLDLRSLVPLDRDAIRALVRRCNRVLIVQEDSRCGGIGESIAAVIQEESFEWLDAPVRILGALDTPVPYSPPLEKYFLVSEDQIETAARLLVAY